MIIYEMNITIVGLKRTEKLLNPFSLLAPPPRQCEHIPADAEVTDTHFDERFCLLEASHLDSGMYTSLQGHLYHLFMRALDFRVSCLSRLTDAYRVIGRTELYHVHALHGQDFLEVIHGALLLYHDGDNHVVHRLRPFFQAGISAVAGASPCAETVYATRLRRLSPDVANALFNVVSAAAVRDKDVI